MTSTIRPAAFRVKIQPAPLDEAERSESDGLPRGKKLRGTTPDRGIIVDVGPGVIEDSDDQDRWDFVREGTVVYYKGGFILDGHVFIQVSENTIIAHED